MIKLIVILKQQKFKRINQEQLNIKFITIQNYLYRKMQSFEQKPNQFFSLGVLILSTSRSDWQMLRDYQEALINIMKEDTQQMSEQNKQPIQHGCTIQYHQNKQSWLYEKYYTLQIYFKNIQDEYPKTKPNFFHIQQQQRQIIITLKISSAQRIQNNLLNLIDKGILKLTNPVTLQNYNQKNQDDYGSSNTYYIAVSVEVSERFLEMVTLKYMEFQQRVNKKSQNYLNQKAQMDVRLNNSGQKEFTDQRNFIEVVRWVIRHDQIKLGQKAVEQIKLARFHNKVSKDQNLHSLFNYQLKKSNKKSRFENKNEEKQLKKTQFIQILSLNFLKENGQGQLFDIDSSKVLQKIKPPGFEGQLKSYQSRALHWMLHREGKKQVELGIDMSHTPFWWNVGSDLRLKQELYINQSLNFISWKEKVQKKCRGGILADQMGLGKTIMIIALILMNRPDQNAKTLIISPLSLIKQWENQLTIFAPFLRVHIINEQNLTDARMDVSDIVIVTQGKLRGQTKNSKGYSHLLNYNWYRIVLDEAHIFKNPKSLMAKNVCQLNAQYRWCLTGTPIQNSINDLFSILKFLRYSPWCFDEWWQKYFNKENLISEYQQYFKIKEILKGVILRRKKQSVDLQGNKLVDLPPVDVKIRLIKMTQEARQFYLLYNYNACSHTSQFEKLEKKIKEFQGEQAVKSLREAKNYKHQMIWSMISKMRMICCHQFLAGYCSNYVTKQKFAAEYLKFLNKNNIIKRKKQRTFESFLNNSEEMKQFQKATQSLSKKTENWDDVVREICLGTKFDCVICKGSHQQVISPCLHVFCKHCINEKVYLEWKNKMIENRVQSSSNNKKMTRIKMKQFQYQCPSCSQPFKLAHLFNMPRINQFNRPVQQYKQNQKIKKLIGYIKQMKYKDKALIFTSFLGMMTLINFSLKKQGIKCYTIEGNNTFEQRHKRISQFSTDPNIIALIITLKTGSVGLNLQVANKIFFMDPWWNPGVEEQALGRTHRIGQQREVQAIKFITQQTIQVRVLKRAFSKKQVSDMILDIDDIENDKRYSIAQSQIRYLLSMNEDIPQIQVEQKQRQKPNSKQKQQQQQETFNRRMVNIRGSIKNQMMMEQKEPIKLKEEIEMLSSMYQNLKRQKQKQKHKQDLNNRYAGQIKKQQQK